MDLVQLQRLSLKLNYVAQGLAVKEILSREPLASGKTRLIADSSGVGEGVLDLMEAQGLRMVRIKITAERGKRRSGGGRGNAAHPRPTPTVLTPPRHHPPPSAAGPPL